MYVNLKEVLPYYDAREYLANGRVKTVIFDIKAVKNGKKELYDVYAADGDKLRLISLFSSLTDGFSFPYSEALENARVECGAKKLEAEAFSERNGIYGYVGGRMYLFGSKSYLKSKGIFLPDAVRRTDFSGYTVLYAADENELMGAFLFFDGISEKAIQAAEAFDKLNVKTVLMGDKREVELAAKCIFVKEKRNAVLKIEKERVLQEFNKSDRIILIDNGADIDRYLRLVTVGKKMQKVRRFNAASVAAGTLFSIIFARIPLFSFLFLVVTSTMVFYNSLAMRHFEVDMPLYKEEEKMFGKVQYTMHIKGMSCAHCSARVKCALEAIRGVSATVSLEEKVARIKCSASLDAGKLTEAVTSAGFTVESVEKV